MGIVTAAVNPNESAYSQVGGNDPNGTQFGSLNVPLSFFGATPTAQPSGNSQAAQVRGAAAGIVSTYSTYQTNVQSAGVNNITSAEYGMTVMQGTVTNSRLLVTAGDMIYINKPTSQAGLGVGNVRVSASNVIGVTLTNYTAATITPVRSEAITSGARSFLSQR